jgi:hypothetical protein
VRILSGWGVWHGKRKTGDFWSGGSGRGALERDCVCFLPQSKSALWYTLGNGWFFKPVRA